jgi:hypothetical protein
VLDENNDSWLTSETAAAMRDLACTVTTAPPLRPAPRFGPARLRRLRPARRGPGWFVPVTVAAVIAALAVSLVLVRDIRNGRAVTGTGDTAASVADGTTVTDPSAPGPQGVPRYYLSIQYGLVRPIVQERPPTNKTYLVAGDLRTGKKLATIKPPAGIEFLDVAAAGDDRTFVVAGIEIGKPYLVEFFRVRLAPGAAQQATVTALPVQATSAGWDDISFPVALSGSGTKLAVVEFAGTTDPKSRTNGAGMTVKVFSVATGALLQQWTAKDSSLASDNLGAPPTLTWIDGDRALALATIGAQGTSAKDDHATWQTVRSIKVGGPARGDLIADSTVVRHALIGSTWGRSTTCGYTYTWPPVISADGKTFTCTTGLAFVAYPLRAGSAGMGHGHVDLATDPKDTWSYVLWSSASGDTIVAAWGIRNDGYVHPTGQSTRIDVISHGRATPLRLPKGFQSGLDAQSVAW